MRKFSDKYINYWDILKNARVGFEFEFYTNKSYYKLLEFLNRELNPIKVSGFRTYHSKFEPSNEHFKIEPDLSLGYDGVELITGPLDYVNSKPIMLKILKILQEYATVDERCSIHINISFNEEKTDETLNGLDPLKLILNIDEEKIYKHFPSRRNNVYAKSVKKMIPFKGYDYSESAVSLLRNNLELPDTKYYGINIANVHQGRLEYRYIGGDKYTEKTEEILDLMDYFILLTNECIVEEFNSDDINLLREYLDDNINNFKSYKKLDNFVGNFPTINLQVNRSSDMNILATYYGDMYEKLYDVINNTSSLRDCVINYDTETNRLEIVEAKISSIFDLKNVNFVNCDIENGSYNNCTFLNCSTKNIYSANSKIVDTKMIKSKLESTYVNSSSILENCYMFNSTLNGTMNGGIFRSGKIGEFGVLSENVKIVTNYNNYFGDDGISDEDKSKNIKKFINNTVNKNKFFIGLNTKKEKDNELY